MVRRRMTLSGTLHGRYSLYRTPLLPTPLPYPGCVPEGVGVLLLLNGGRGFLCDEGRAVTCELVDNFAAC